MDALYLKWKSTQQLSRHMLIDHQIRQILTGFQRQAAYVQLSVAATVPSLDYCCYYDVDGDLTVTACGDQRQAAYVQLSVAVTVPSLDYCCYYSADGDLTVTASGDHDVPLSLRQKEDHVPAVYNLTLLVSCALPSPLCLELEVNLALSP